MFVDEPASPVVRPMHARVVNGRAVDCGPLVRRTTAATLALLKDGNRLVDLVRYSRHRLHEEGLISDDEYAELVAIGSKSARRLEGYDVLIAERNALRDELAVLADRVRIERLRESARRVLMYHDAPSNDHNRLALEQSLEELRAAIEQRPNPEQRDGDVQLTPDAAEPCPRCGGEGIVEDGGPGQVLVCAACKGTGTWPPCAVCGKPAACWGAYEGATEPTAACGSCCGHGNEDGHCEPLA